MQPNFTLKQVEVLFLKPLLAFCLLILIGTSAVAQQYTNGPLSTGASTSNGTAAPAGFTWSEVQGANTIAGYGANITANTVADDFTVPAGPSWGVTKISFFAYSTGFAGSTSPFNDVRVAIYNTNPSVGNPTPIFGDRTTNRFAASSSASMYRIFNATPGTTRQIFRVEANVSVTLAPGTYWIEWGVGTSQASNFSPPVTIVGAAGATGANAIQRTVTTGAWAALVDGTTRQCLLLLIMLPLLVPEHLLQEIPFLLLRLFVPVSTSHCHFKIQLQVVELLTSGSLQPTVLPGQILPELTAPVLPEAKQLLLSIAAR
jgi:hypothetical protein